MLPAPDRLQRCAISTGPGEDGRAQRGRSKGTDNRPAGRCHYNRVYVLAASADGDQKATFESRHTEIELNIQDWGGFIGQWDDRSVDFERYFARRLRPDGWLKPGYIKRADLAWYCSHHHNAAGENIAYSYSYLFAYAIDLPAGIKSITLPDNDKIRILAISVANENPEVQPAQPLYDVLPSPSAGPSDFTFSTSSSSVSVPQGRSATSRIIIMPRGSFAGNVTLSASELPAGVTASFAPASTAGSSTLTLAADRSTNPTTASFTITGAAGNVSRSIPVTASVTPVMTGTVPVDLASVYNVTGIYNDGTSFAPSASLDGGGFALSEQLLGREQVGSGVVFEVGPANTPDAVTGKIVTLPQGKFDSLKILAVGVNGDQELQTFAVIYADSTSSTFTQSLSDWASPRNFTGESVAVTMPYRLTADGSKDGRNFYLFAYSFGLDSNKVVRSLSLPMNREALVFAATLVTARN